MAPRAYTLRRRAESASATRRRILDAARALYLEHGIRATTLTAVARRADVSRGTILHHFGGADGLLEAVLDTVVAGLHYPDERVLDGAADAADRIRRYVDAMYRFFVRSEADWPAFSRDLDHPILKRREAEYYEVVGKLYTATFGELAADRIVAAAVRALVDYWPLNALRSAGLTLDEAIALVGDVLVDLASRRTITEEAPA